MPFLALQGLRAIEIGDGVAGPFCAKMLADYGAEVIKVEKPDTGDSSRQEGPFPDDAPHIEKSGLFLHLNTNKKGVTLDLESPAGQKLFRELVRESHALVESQRPGKMDSLGLGYHALKQLRPDLVMTSITPFGQTGPHKDYEFTELTVFATSGAMYREGLPVREPLKYGGEMAQYFAGAAAAAATMAACFRSSLSGQGEWIDISIQECMAGHPHQAGRRAPFAYAGEADARTPPRVSAAGAREPYAVGTFRCKDGYVSFLPLGPRMWPNFARMIGRPHLLDDPRYLTPGDREERGEELEALFQSWLDARTRDEVFKAAHEARVPGGPVLKVDEVMSNEHLKARDAFVTIEHPDAGTLTYTDLPFRLSDTPREDARPAPRLGQHNKEVFGGILGTDKVDMPSKGQV